jgi:hypothetical protein
MGEIKRGKASIYVNKLADIDTTETECLIKETVTYISKKYQK